MLGDNLYELSRRDLSVTPLDVVAFNDKTTIGSTNFLVFSPPLDRLFMLRNYNVKAEAGLLQTLIQCELAVCRVSPFLGYEPISIIETFTSADGFSGDSFNPISTTANKSIAFHSDCEIFIPAGSIIVLRTQYNAAANINTTTLSLMGMSIPRGNISI